VEQEKAARQDAILEENKFEDGKSAED